jgi:uncharacterized protein (DUF983 family)
MKRLGRRLLSILRLRCPRCLDGKVFAGFVTMNLCCPRCGVRFEREPGYFLGSLYASYFLSVGILTVFYLLISALFPHWSSLQAAAVALVPYAPFIPLIYRYSRVIWMHIDWWGKPDAEGKTTAMESSERCR